MRHVLEICNTFINHALHSYRLFDAFATCLFSEQTVHRHTNFSVLSEPVSAPFCTGFQSLVFVKYMRQVLNIHALKLGVVTKDLM